MKKHIPNITIAVTGIVIAGVAIAVHFNRQNTFFPSSASISPNPKSSTLAANAEYEPSEVGDFYYGPSESTISATPLPSPVPLSVYIYQGSTTLSKSLTRIEMESNANSTTITNWYKDKIRDLNFNAKSFSQTNTNGVIFNKLSAVKPGEKIEITIKKDQTTSKVLITVDRS